MNTMTCSDDAVNICVYRNTPTEGVLMHICAMAVGPVVKTTAATGCAILANGARQQVRTARETGRAVRHTYRRLSIY